MLTHFFITNGKVARWCSRSFFVVKIFLLLATSFYLSFLSKKIIFWYITNYLRKTITKCFDYKENFIEGSFFFTICIVNNLKIIKYCTSPITHDMVMSFLTRIEMLIDFNLFRDVHFLILATQINSTCGIYRESTSAFQWNLFFDFWLESIESWRTFNFLW